MYHIMEMLYYPWALYVPLIIFAAIILFIASVIFVFKKKKVVFIIFTVIFGFIAYHGIPHYYTLKARFANNDIDIEKNYGKALKTACFSSHKGFISADEAGYFFMAKNGASAVKYFNIAHKYLKNYKSTWAWAVAPLVYILNEDYDKAIEIAVQVGEYSTASTACILKEDYICALDYINKALDKKTDDAGYFIQRAVIYENMGKSQEAQNDYQRAVKLCRYSDCIERAKNSYGNYKTWYKEYYKQQRIEYGLNARENF